MDDLTPSNENTAKTAELSQRLEAMMTYVRDCQKRVHAGETPDLSNLDKKTAELCNDITALPHPDSQIFGEKLKAYIAAIDTLTLALKDRTS